MGFLNFLALAALSFVVAYRPATLPETVEEETQTAPSPTFHVATPSTEEIVTDSESPPVTTPTREQVEVAQNSPIATPSPARAANEEPEREIDKASVQF